MILISEVEFDANPAENALRMHPVLEESRGECPYLSKGTRFRSALCPFRSVILTHDLSLLAAQGGPTTYDVCNSRWIPKKGVTIPHIFHILVLIGVSVLFTGECQKIPKKCEYHK